MSVLQKLKNKIKKSPKWKARIHKFMFSNGRPRFWVKAFINPFYFHHGKGFRYLLTLSSLGHGEGHGDVCAGVAGKQGGA